MTDAPTSTAADAGVRRFILASTVKGTPVFDRALERIGEIADIAIGKRDGKVVYAVLSFGGFLGVGEKFHPVPWSALRYDMDQNGYVISLGKDQLQGAPSYDKAELADAGDPDQGLVDTLGSFYGQYGVSALW